MEELRRLDVDPAALQREVCSPYRERRSCGLIGLVAAALLMAAGIDAALWHHNLERRQIEVRAMAAEQRAAALVMQNQALRDQLGAAQAHASALHDELVARNRADEIAQDDDATAAPGAKVRVIEVTVVPAGSTGY